MNPLWLLVIVPVSASFGAIVMALMNVAGLNDEEEDDG